MLRDVGINDVHCQQILDALPSDFPLLKGADYIVVESAKSLGLPVCVKPFVDNDYREDQDFCYAFKEFSQCMYEDDIPGDVNLCYDVEPLQMFGNALSICKAQDITWCQELSYHQPAGAAYHYGNEASVDLWYKSAAILIRIPKWSEFRQRLIAISTGECCDITGAEDGMVKDFKDIIKEDVVHEKIQDLNKEIDRQPRR